MKKYVVLCSLILGISPPGMALAKQPVLAAISGEASCKATNKDQGSQRATLRLLRTGSGYRLLEVENEKYKASGPAAQVENKETGEVSYFLAFGDRGTINARFSVTPAGTVKARLHIIAFPRTKTSDDEESKVSAQANAGEDEQSKSASAGWTYQYDCVKKQ